MVTGAWRSTTCAMRRVALAERPGARHEGHAPCWASGAVLLKAPA